MITYGVKYIGSKKTLNKYIVELIQTHCGEVETAIDVFTGTTRVAQALRQSNIEVTSSDLSWASEAYAHTFVHNNDNNHLAPLIEELNNIKPKAGWLTKHYCDVMSKDGNNGLVRVWQPKNGKKADAIRNYIDTLKLEHWEKMTLITSLIFALDAVDNTVGVQQAYLKNWCTRSHKDLKLKLPPMLWEPRLGEKTPPKGKHLVGDALKLDYSEADIAYLDPPYSPHSYATYYHIWDSIMKWDQPDVDLKTNRRVDRCAKNKLYDSSFESSWNRKKGSHNAFERLIERLPVRYVLVSYSSDSIVPIDQLIATCETFGEVEIDRIDYKRNIMCKIGNMTDDAEVVEKNQELLILIDKGN